MEFRGRQGSHVSQQLTPDINEDDIISAASNESRIYDTTMWQNYLDDPHCDLNNKKSEVSPEMLHKYPVSHTLEAPKNLSL